MKCAPLERCGRNGRGDSDATPDSSHGGRGADGLNKQNRGGFGGLARCISIELQQWTGGRMTAQECVV